MNRCISCEFFDGSDMDSLKEGYNGRCIGDGDMVYFANSACDNYAPVQERDMKEIEANNAKSVEFYYKLEAIKSAFNSVYLGNYDDLDPHRIMSAMSSMFSALMEPHNPNNRDGEK